MHLLTVSLTCFVSFLPPSAEACTACKLCEHDTTLLADIPRPKTPEELRSQFAQGHLSKAAKAKALAQQAMTASTVEISNRWAQRFKAFLRQENACVCTRSLLAKQLAEWIADLAAPAIASDGERGVCAATISVAYFAVRRVLCRRHRSGT